MKVRVAVYNVKKNNNINNRFVKINFVIKNMFGVFAAIFVFIKCFDWCICSCGRGKDDANYIL